MKSVVFYSTAICSEAFWESDKSWTCRLNHRRQKLARKDWISPRAQTGLGVRLSWTACWGQKKCGGERGYGRSWRKIIKQSCFHPSKGPGHSELQHLHRHAAKGCISHIYLQSPVLDQKRHKQWCQQLHWRREGRNPVRRTGWLVFLTSLLSTPQTAVAFISNRYQLSWCVSDTIHGTTLRWCIHSFLHLFNQYF